ncbi:heavy metal translocating P-type ATPase [Peptostreptococcaceae bacterium AGR-M142]
MESLKKPNKIDIQIIGVACANCARKIEDKINSLDQVLEASLNFATGRISILLDENACTEEYFNKVKKIILDIEPHVQVEKFDRHRVNLNVLEGGCVDSCCSSSNNHDHFEHEHNHSNSSHTHNHSNENTNHYHDGCCGDTQSKSSKKSNFKYNNLINKNALFNIVGTILFIIGLVFEFEFKIEFSVFFIAYILVAKDILKMAIRNILRGSVFDENFLMSIASIGAFLVGEYPEAVAVMLFYKIGEYFQDKAVNKSRDSIKSLMSIRPDYANLIIDGRTKKVSPYDVKINDIIVVKPGEKVPLDGELIEGESSFDTSNLTGESMLRYLKEDDEVLSGFINKQKLVKLRVKEIFSNSTVSKILDLVENAGSKKANAEKFITKFSRYYTPIVVFVAALIAIIPIFLGYSHKVWIYRALIFLVVSCPCALVVSIPLSFFGGIGGASKNGILVKGGNYLEALKDASILVFDKTGTLTHGNFKVSEINTLDSSFSKDDILKLAAICEIHTTHPIGKSIVNEYIRKFKTNVDESIIHEYEDILGHGVKTIDKDDNIILAGNKRLMNKFDIEFKDDGNKDFGSCVYIAFNDILIGSIIIEDEIKSNAKQMIKNLKNLNIKKIIMLTGDVKQKALKVSKELGIEEFYYELLPADKIKKVEELNNLKSKNEKLVFVGDGINDAPVLALSDIGFSMGGVGSDAAIEASDIVLMNDDLLKIPLAIDISRFTNKIVWQNIIFAFVVKIAVMILGTFGMANMWEAVFADVGVALIAVLNASRILRYKVK